MKTISNTDFKIMLSVLKIIKDKTKKETVLIQNTRRKASKLYKKLQKITK